MTILLYSVADWLLAWFQDVVHAAASPQWLASGPGYPVGRRSGRGDPIWPRLGPHMYGDG